MNSSKGLARSTCPRVQPRHDVRGAARGSPCSGARWRQIIIFSFICDASSETCTLSVALLPVLRCPNSRARSCRPCVPHHGVWHVDRLVGNVLLPKNLHAVLVHVHDAVAATAAGGIRCVSGAGAVQWNSPCVSRALPPGCQWPAITATTHRRPSSPASTSQTSSPSRRRPRSPAAPMSGTWENTATFSPRACSGELLRQPARCASPNAPLNGTKRTSSPVRPATICLALRLDVIWVVGLQDRQSLFVGQTDPSNNANGFRVMSATLTACSDKDGQLLSAALFIWFLLFWARARSPHRGEAEEGLPSGIVSGCPCGCPPRPEASPLGPHRWRHASLGSRLPWAAG